MKQAKSARFVNADLIAAGLSPLAPERELVAASRLFLDEIESCIEKGAKWRYGATRRACIKAGLWQTQ